MNRWRRHRLAVVVIASGGFAAVGAAGAQESGELNVDVADCVKLEAPDQRLACFEARVRAAQQRRAPAPAETPPPAEAPAPAASNGSAAPPPAERETPPRQARRREAERPEARPAEAQRQEARPAEAPRPGAQPAKTASAKAPRETRHEAAAQAREAWAETDEIVSRVQSLRETVPNAYLITLENGQVWRQMRPQSYPLRPGQDVRIYGTRWGTASRLTADELKSYIQVERVQ
jgi:hypothetical protein